MHINYVWIHGFKSYSDKTAFQTDIFLHLRSIEALTGSRPFSGHFLTSEKSTRPNLKGILGPPRNSMAQQPATAQRSAEEISGWFCRG